MRLPKEKKIFGLAGALAAVCGAAFFFLTLNQRDRVEKISELRSAAVKGIAEKRLLSSAKEKNLESAEKRAVLETRFIPRDGVVSFLNFIQGENFGERLKIKILSVVIEPGSAGENFETVKIELTTEGSWSEALRFAGLLELIPYKITLTETILSRKEEGEAVKGPKENRWLGSFKFAVLKIK